MVNRRSSESSFSSLECRSRTPSPPLSPSEENQIIPTSSTTSLLRNISNSSVSSSYSTTSSQFMTMRRQQLSQNQRRPGSYRNNKRRKRSFPYYTKLLVWAIGLVVMVMAVINFGLHLEQDDGSWPRGIRFKVNYGSQESEFYFGKLPNQLLQNDDAKNNVQANSQGHHQLQSPRHLKRPRTKGERQPTVATPSLDKKAAEDAKKREMAAQKNLLEVQKEKAKAKKKQAPKGPTVFEKEKGKGNVHTIQYYLELSQSQGHDKEPLLRLIRNNAGIRYISEVTYDQLPTWSQVTAMYGSQPSIVGKEQCTAFQQNGDLGDKFLAVAGMFNSGTNFLSKALVRNCVLHKRQEKYGIKHKGIRWQVPYGKHTPPKDKAFRESHVAQKSEGVDATQVLPAVMVRDPFRWLQSMCSHHYTTRWPRVFPRTSSQYHCPNLVPTQAEKERLAALHFEPLVEGYSKFESETTSIVNETDTELDAGANEEEEDTSNKQWHEENPFLVAQDDNTTDHHSDSKSEDLFLDELTEEELALHYFPARVKYSNFTRHHRSLVHLWNEWNNEYVGLNDFPHIMVRMEDLLFFPDTTVKTICECAGGRLSHNHTLNPHGYIKLVPESAKATHSKKFMEEGQDHTGYLDALIRYGSPSTRFRGMTPHDLQYAQHYLDASLMKLFQYDYPPSELLKPKQHGASLLQQKHKKEDQEMMRRQ